MTRQKSFKSRVRTRMAKTGESYTTARRQLIQKAEPRTADPREAEPTTAPPPAPATEPVRGQQRSDQTIRERTGRGWDEWFGLLDAWGATERRHAEIARWLVTEHRVGNWWSQTITVGYEQARGLRAPGQQPDGWFAAGVSRTMAVPVDRLFQAFADPVIRARWLPGDPVRVRTATAPKTFRADWAGGPTRIVVGFNPKGEHKAQLGLQHERLADAAAAAEQKAYWQDRLAALKQLLEQEGAAA